MSEKKTQKRANKASKRSSLSGQSIKGARSNLIQIQQDLNGALKDEVLSLREALAADAALIAFLKRKVNEMQATLDAVDPLVLADHNHKQKLRKVTDHAQLFGTHFSVPDAQRGEELQYSPAEGPDCPSIIRWVVDGDESGAWAEGFVTGVVFADRTCEVTWGKGGKGGPLRSMVRFDQIVASWSLLS